MRYWTTKLNKEYESSKLSWFCKKEVTEKSFYEVVEYLKQNGISFTETNNENSDAFYLEENRVYCAKNLAPLLHEAGHAICKHKPAWDNKLKKVVKNNKEVIADELEAWDKGFEIMKQLDIRCSNYSQWADECLETYFN